MCSPERASNLVRACLGIVSLIVVTSASGQDEIGRVTGVSFAGEAAITASDGARVSVGPFYSGSYTAPEQSQLMAALGDSAAVLVVNGPAVFSVLAERGGLTIAVSSGSVSLSVAGTTTGKLAISGGTTNKLNCESVPPGAVVSLRVDARGSHLSFSSGFDAAKLAVTAGGQTESLLVGEAVSVEGGAARRGTADAYSTAVPEHLSLGYAQTLRGSVDKSLFEEIVGWDRFAGSDEVQKKLPASRTTPEVRQVAVTVSTVNVVSARGGVTRPEGTIGANQVPIISPASLVVQAGADGAFTVVSNNRLAAANLTLTGSQGLGFGGSAALSIQGLIGGFRFVGPAGLGGR